MHVLYSYILFWKLIKAGMWHASHRIAHVGLDYLEVACMHFMSLVMCIYKDRTRGYAEP